MAPKKDPAARRAREAARRATAAERIGPRPVRTPKPRRPKTLYDLAPPGVYYQDWDTPTGVDEVLMAKVAETFGPDSGPAETMRTLLDYRDLYGPSIPTAAARHLEQILACTDLTALAKKAAGVAPEEARDSLHSLHAQGLLLIADDGSLWLTVPPGTPYSAPHGQWAFVEKTVDAPPKPVPAG
ncbi:hypothetical protein ACPXCP_34135 [Streptomyces sp. DT20]|uniref:hypothetical protein n=1 Tax=Streptomyces sp. DT20 TaxID=3416519 RepID=UPI003CE7DCB3